MASNAGYSADLSRGSVDDYLRPKLLALGDGFGGPAVTSSVTASRCGHCHPSLINTGPRSGGRWDGCQQQRLTSPAKQQCHKGD